MPATADAGTVTVPLAMVNCWRADATGAGDCPVCRDRGVAHAGGARGHRAHRIVCQQIHHIGDVVLHRGRPSLTASTTSAVAVALDTAPPLALAALVEPVKTMDVLLSSPPPAVPGAV